MPCFRSGFVGRQGTGNGFHLPTIFPADGTDGWKFSGSTLTEQSGNLNGAGANMNLFGAQLDDLSDGINNPFLVAHAGSADIENGAGPMGQRAVKTSYPISTTDDFGMACNAYFNNRQTKILCYRMLFKQTVYSGNSVKGARFSDQAGGTICTVGVNPTGTGDNHGVWQIGLDNYAIGLPTDSGILFLDNTWYCVEVLLDMTNPLAYNVKMWINNVLGINLTRNVTSFSNPDPTTFLFGHVQIDGTINVPLAAGTQYITDIAISNQRIGMPAGFVP